MTPPIRLQRSRRKGFDLQALSLATNGLPAVSVARPGKWGNPFLWKAFLSDECSDRQAKEMAVALFSNFLKAQPNLGSVLARELRGKNLACFCRLDAPCHADVLLRLANITCEGI